MKPLLPILLLLLSLPLHAQFASAPAFPGAEGFARYTTGGRGGVIYHVTTLDDYIDDSKYGTKPSSSEIKSLYSGTLRYAINQSGPRIIVFDIAGTIDLKCPLRIKRDDITILGQTAPADGICLKNYTLGIAANNVIIRFIRTRMGDECKAEDDAMNAAHKDGDEFRNIIIDHCSMSWCTDECGSFYGNINFTLQWCILSESLRNSVHDKGKHGYGGIWGGQNAAFHHNLLAHHDSRNPRFDHGYLSTLPGPIDYINNVVYNWGGNSTYGGENKPGCSPKLINMIANFYKPGPFTLDSTKNSNRLLNPTTKCSNCNAADQYDIVPGKFFLQNNIVNGTEATVSKTNIAFDSGFSLDKFRQNCLLTSRALATDHDFALYPTISTHTPTVAYNKVLSFAGASYRRDHLDAVICQDALQGTATHHGSRYNTPGLIDTQSDAQDNRPSPWPDLTGTGTAPLDTDADGIPDTWESENGLNPSDPSDAAIFTLDPKRYYTNIEVYANSLVEGIIRAQRAAAQTTFEEYYPIIKSKIPTPPEETSITPIPAATTPTTTYTLAGHKPHKSHRGIIIKGNKKLIK